MPARFFVLNGHKAFSAAIAALCAVALLSAPRPAFAAEPVAGDACSTSNQIVVTGGPETTGVRHTLRCNGTKWVQEQTIDASANSGFGTASPAARIDINGGMKVGYNSGGCSGTNNGELRYNSTTAPAWNYCNGSNWVAFADLRLMHDFDPANPGFGTSPKFPPSTVLERRGSVRPRAAPFHARLTSLQRLVCLGHLPDEVDAPALPVRG